MAPSALDTRPARIAHPEADASERLRATLVEQAARGAALASCGDPIPAARLEVLPQARTCVRCAARAHHASS